MSTPLMHQNTIQAPVITEKSYALSAKNKFVFRVDPAASKYQIKKAVEDMFKVEVLSINTVKKSARTYRSAKTGRYHNTSISKKAIVEIKAGQKIDIFSAFENK